MRRLLPTPRAFTTGLIALQAAVGLASAAGVVAYLVALLELTPSQWRTFAAIIGGYVVCGGSVSELVSRRSRAPIEAWLAARTRSAAAPELARAAFPVALDFPRRAFALGLANYVAAGAAIAVGLKLRFADFPAVSAGVILAACATAGFAMNAFFFFAVKERLAPLRAALADELPDPAERDRLAPPLPLAAKLQVSLCGVAVSTVLFAVFFAEAHARGPLVRQTAALEQRFLEAAVPRLARADAAEIERLRNEARQLGLAAELALADPAAHEAPAGLEPSAWQAVRSSGAASGDSRALGSPTVFAWQALPDGRVAVLAQPAAALHAHLGSLWGPFGLLLASATGVAVLLARFIARDVSAGATALAGLASRLASGDLRGQAGVESEDELGELSRAFERMVEALRGTVVRVGEAAERLEGTAAGLEGVGQSVEAATGDQAEGVVGARDGVEALEGQMGGIAGSAQALSASVEESGSSVLELSASGEQLSETARGLEARVGEVSGSIGQTLRSVREVGSRAEALYEAAVETSGSMEEMAGSLREVDGNAEQMGRLAQRVVEAAEGGAERVRRAREGMEAIREATVEAEAGMRGLSARAEAIGAIVDVIDSVADETNLLALNAAIIAAQAGEQGRAFSVVAEEIKELADRVLSGAAEIGGLIRSMQAESAAAVAAVERGSRSVREGMGLSVQAGEALEAIRAAARESGARTGEIVTAVREQSRAASHVVELMERVREGAERIRGAGREQEQGHEVVAAGALAMREVAGQVHRTTAEQARGAGRIRDSLERVREAVGTIHRALEEQRTGATRAAHALRRVASRTDAHRESVRQMADATRDLRAQAKSLRDDVKRFRT